MILKPFFRKCGLISYMGSPAYLMGLRHVVLGNRVRIYPGIRIECLPQSELTIKDNCSIGQNLHITAGGRLTIEEGVTISGNVLITDIDHEYTQNNTPIMQQPIKIKETTISKNCFIGYGAVILPGTFLGEQCVVGANAVVRGTFPAHSVIAGTPGKVIKTF